MIFNDFITYSYALIELAEYLGMHYLTISGLLKSEISKLKTCPHISIVPQNGVSVFHHNIRRRKRDAGFGSVDAQIPG